MVPCMGDVAAALGFFSSPSVEAQLDLGYLLLDPGLLMCAPPIWCLNRILTPLWILFPTLSGQTESATRCLRTVAHPGSSQMPPCPWRFTRRLGPSTPATWHTPDEFSVSLPSIRHILGHFARGSWLSRVTDGAGCSLVKLTYKTTGRPVTRPSRFPHHHHPTNNPALKTSVYHPLQSFILLSSCARCFSSPLLSLHLTFLRYVDDDNPNPMMIND